MPALPSEPLRPTAYFSRHPIAKRRQRRLTAACGGLGGTAVIESLESRTLLSGISFAGQIVTKVGNTPLSTVTGDFNHDGRVDVATANYGGNNISILLGNGDGTFTSEPTVGVGSNPLFVAAADLNGDTHEDLVVANRNSGTVTILLGNGDGTFAAEQTVAVGNQPVAAVVADVNGDGKPDLIIANYGSGTISVLLGNGNGTFATQHTFAVGNGPFAITAAKFAPAGPVDLVVANYSDNTVSVLAGDGHGNFSMLQTLASGTHPDSVAVGDFNGDGRLDLAAANFGDGTISLFDGNGNGTFGGASTIAAGNTPLSLVAADLNGNGTPDLVVANFDSSTVSVLVGNGDGTFQGPQSFSVEALPFSVSVADFNGDGKTDILCSSDLYDNVSVLLNTSAAPAITSANGTTFTTGVAGTFGITTSGSPGVTTLSEMGALPSGVSFVDNANGLATLAGTAAAGTGGTYTFTITATNGVDPNGTQVFTLTVDQAPAITSGSGVTFTAGHAGTFDVITSGFPAASLSETGALPNGVTFVNDGNGSATLAGTAAAGTGGTYTLTITAANGVSPSAVQTFTLIVNTPIVPAVSGFVVDDGTAQRAMIRKLTVVFNEPVTLAAGAITLGLRNPGAASTPQTFNLTNPSSDQKTYILTFTGAGYVGGSLNDGVYDLVVHAGLVQDAGGNHPGGDQTFSFYRLYADYFGDGSVGFEDLVLLAQDFGATAGQSDYLSFMDIDGDGTIGFAELVKLAQNFGDSLSVSAAAPLTGMEPLAVKGGSAAVAINPAYVAPGAGAVTAADGDGMDSILAGGDDSIL